MGFFGPSKPKRVTKQEWKKIWSNLYGKLDKYERDELEKLFRADMHEANFLEEGISREEFESAMQWLEANPRKHKFEADDIAHIKQQFEIHLKD
jgi:BMFP domain-containing protein YqiC